MAVLDLDTTLPMDAKCRPSLSAACDLAFWWAPLGHVVLGVREGIEQLNQPAFARRQRHAGPLIDRGGDGDRLALRLGDDRMGGHVKRLHQTYMQNRRFLG